MSEIENERWSVFSFKILSFVNLFFFHSKQTSVDQERDGLECRWIVSIQFVKKKKVDSYSIQ